jgi:hypothetical protein
MARKVRRQKLRFFEPILISVPEFARLSGLGYSMARQLVADGVLPTRVIGARTWILREEAIAWLQKQVDATPRPPRIQRRSPPAA